MYLCDEGKLDILTNFPYDDCLFEVYMILVSKARSVSIYDNSFQTQNFTGPDRPSSGQTQKLATSIKFYEIAISLLIKKKHFHLASKVYVEIYKRYKSEGIPSWMGIDKYLENLEESLLPCIMMLGMSDKKFVCYDGDVNFGGYNFAHQRNTQRNEIITLELLQRHLLRIQKLQILINLNTCPSHPGSNGVTLTIKPDLA
jgi:hypothetical protein